MSHQPDSPEPMVLLEQPAPGVALLRLNRPKARNALNMALREELAGHFRRLDECPVTRVIILTGSDTVFAAGADLGEMVDATALELYARHAERHWQAISACRKPVIAAVNGFALGGGCELAMHCDLIIAGTSARFAQPEVKVGVMPGAGGTQRLVRAVGKFQALRMLFTGCLVSAEEALDTGAGSGGRGGGRGGRGSDAPGAGGGGGRGAGVPRTAPLGSNEELSGAGRRATTRWWNRCARR